MKVVSFMRFTLVLLFLLKLDVFSQTCGEKIQKDYDEITAAELLKLINTKDDFLLIDNRTQREYDEGHIPGAVLIPVDSYAFDRTSPVGEMIQKIREKENSHLHFVLKDSFANEQYISHQLLKIFLNLLPADKDKLIVLYDRRRTCIRSSTFTQWIRILGYRNIKRYMPGWAGWEKGGYQIEKKETGGIQP